MLNSLVDRLDRVLPSSLIIVRGGLIVISGSLIIVLRGTIAFVSIHIDVETLLKILGRTVALARGTSDVDAGGRKTEPLSCCP